MASFKHPRYKNTEWLTWHFPSFKNSRISSAIAIFFFLVLFVVCIRIYSKVNSITTHSYIIDVECLNAKEIKDVWNCKVIPSASIKYCIPMTETSINTANNSVSFKTFIPNKQMEERFRFLLEYPKGARNDFDSLSNVFWHHFNSQKKDTMCCFYYIKSTQSLNQKLYNYNVKQGENSVGETSQRGKYVIKYQNTDSSTSQEIFNLFPNATFYNNKWNLKNIGGASMSNLGWFAAFDISQAYYSINLNSSTIDSLTLEIGFVGATDFSKMIPEPDIITMRSIKFTHPKKIMTIKKNGLQFHAHFKETENRQTIRLYILTGVLSAIVGFLLRALYRLYIINNKQQ